MRLVLFPVAMLCAATAVAKPRSLHDQATVRAAIEAGARACEAGNPEEVMRSYAPDIVLSYPGVADQDYAALSAGYARLCGSGEGTVETTHATFEEVLVSGDIAIARLVWRTHLRGMPDGSYRRLRDFQVWKRTPAGWRFIRGVHYPLKD